MATDISDPLYEKYAIIRSLKFLRPVMNFMIKTPWHGAQTTLYCVLDDSIENESGSYYSDCAKKTPTDFAKDLDAAKRLWTVSEKLVGLDKQND